jgi:hypothetical protein
MSGSPVGLLARTLIETFMCAAVPPARHAWVTGWCYAIYSRDYKPGARPFEEGLHDWESATLDSPLFPRRGHVLLGGAGGGRELRTLLQRGFTVTAFEPSTMWTSALEVAGNRAAVLCGSYSDFVRAVTNGDGPLQEIAKQRFDAIVLGWGSICHITADELQELFVALRKVGPRAPVLLSFQLESPPHRFTPLKARLHKVLQRLGAPGEPCPRGLIFTRRAGFMYQFTTPTLYEIAATTGYTVAHYVPEWYSHAVWVPSAADSKAGP